MFGKDPTRLGRVPAFGGSLNQRATAFKDHSRGPRTTRGRRFSDEYKPPMGPHALDVGRLLPGNYTVQIAGDEKGESLAEVQLEFFPFVEHFDGRTNKSSVCSGGPLHNFKGKRDDCRGCDMFYEGLGAPKGTTKRMSKRDMFVFNFLHMAPYHKVESLDQNTGQIRVNERGEPYYDWHPCEGRTCTACKAGKETKHGRVRPWPMGYSHFNTLIEAYNPLVGNSCASCGTKNSIRSIAWVCPVEGCGEAIIDLSTTTMTDADIAKIVMREIECPACKNRVMAQEMYECTACGNARRASIFDVNIHVQRINNSKEGGNQTTLMVTDWSHPCPIDPSFTEIAKPLPLDKMYAPTPLEVQDRLFEAQGAGPVTNQGYRPYGGGQPVGGPQGPNYGH